MSNANTSSNVTEIYLWPRGKQAKNQFKHSPLNVSSFFKKLENVY